MSEQHYEFDNPAWVTYIQPFTIIRKDEEADFTVGLDQINNDSYDHFKLCEVVTSLAYPKLALSGLAVLVCLDGAIAIPAVGDFRREDNALDLFNEVLCSLFLGGVLGEAVDRRDMVGSQLHKGRWIWPVDLGGSLNSRSHAQLRMRIAGTIERIALSEPYNLRLTDFRKAFDHGAKAIGALSDFTPTLFLRGATEFRYGNLSDALANLWICVEQLTQILWSRRFLAESSLHPVSLPKRLESLENDNRTWSAVVRQELLWQTGAIGEKTFSSLFQARRARNDLVHLGKRPDRRLVESLYDAVLSLIESISGIAPNSINRRFDPYLRLPGGEEVPPEKKSFGGWKDLVARIGV